MKKSIHNPSPLTRMVQKKVKRWLEQHAQPTEYSFYGKSNSTTDLESFKEILSFIRIDMESAYDSITYSRVVGLFKQLSMPEATLHAKYCVWNGSLMRGGITSNYIFELILRRLDYRLAGLSSAYGYYYNRYVDDLYFFRQPGSLLDTRLYTQVVQIVFDEGFDINADKIVCVPPLVEGQTLP